MTKQFRSVNRGPKFWILFGTGFIFFCSLLVINAWPISLYIICRVVLYSTPDEITNIPDYTWIIGSFDSGVSLIMTLIWGNVRSCRETAMLDTSSLFIFTFDTGDESLKFASLGIMMGKAVRVIAWVSEVTLFSSIPLVKLPSLAALGLL